MTDKQAIRNFPHDLSIRHLFFIRQNTPTYSITDMTKSKLFTWFLLLPLLFVCSCSNNEDDPTPKPEPIDIVEPDTAETTIFIYMPYTGYDNELTEELQGNLTAIRNVIKTNKGMGNDKVIVFISEDENKSHLLQYHYSHLRDTTVTDTLKTFANRELDFTSSKLIESLATMVKAQALADDYAMIIGCHAIGWIHKNSMKYLSTRTFGGNSEKFQMENIELAKGLAAAGIEKLKYLVFDDCYMANVETAYELRSCTHKLIASTCEIMGVGLPYQTMFQYLLDTPDYEKAIEAFGTFYKQYSFPYGTLSLIDCDQLESFAGVMKQVNSQTEELTESEVAEVQRFDGYRHAVFFDLGDYIAKRCKDNTSLLEQANQALDLLVPYAVNTPEYYVYGGFPSPKFRINSYSGITCSDPSLNGAIKEDKLETEWWLATHE